MMREQVWSMRESPADPTLATTYRRVERLTIPAATFLANAAIAASRVPRSRASACGLLMMPKGERPQPWLADRRGNRLHPLGDIGNR
jgi:hypothetical protein